MATDREMGGCTVGRDSTIICIRICHFPLEMQQEGEREILRAFSFCLLALSL